MLTTVTPKPARRTRLAAANLPKARINIVELNRPSLARLQQFIITLLATGRK